MVSCSLSHLILYHILSHYILYDIVLYIVTILDSKKCFFHYITDLTPQGETFQSVSHRLSASGPGKCIFGPENHIVGPENNIFGPEPIFVS